MGGQQLWASMVEKAYAKAHGSYQAISGGMVRAGCPITALLLVATGMQLCRTRPGEYSCRRAASIDVPACLALLESPHVTGGRGVARFDGGPDRNHRLF
eukprot:scaffold9164_cov29-Tisochrysis_lutea.AAC.2